MPKQFFNKTLYVITKSSVQRELSEDPENMRDWDEIYDSSLSKQIIKEATIENGRSKVEIVLNSMFDSMDRSEIERTELQTMLNFFISE